MFSKGMTERPAQAIFPGTAEAMKEIIGRPLSV